jgi:cellulose synthase/poly-beta-1,6-N-acetylglucosamine synthase-like glycosyltransferase
MSRADVAVLTLYYVTLGVLTLLALHRLHLVRLRRRTHPPPAPAACRDWPHVAVQLPLYNEPGVAIRLLDAVASMRYPGAVSIQVIDDSTDGTTALVAGRVAALEREGRTIRHIRRGTRDGYKAGALAHGSRDTDARLFAVFDADFVPPPDFLERTVPYLADPAVGMVQARWGHLNREESLLTRVQAIYLDAHFAVESAARNYSGRFFNFNGTAGVWRREAIEGSGGWSAETLTEDLDLSYRAQLAGWKFVFVEDLEVPAELPGSVSAFQQQQARWAEGSIQTARKVLPAILRSGLPAFVKTEAAFHLTSNLAYLLSIVLAVLIVPSVTLRYASGLSMLLAVDLVLLAISTTSIVVFYLEGQRRAGGRRPTLRELLAVMPLGLGISLRNGWAVARGLWRDGGEFKRTPKRGTEGPLRPPRTSLVPLPELAMAIVFLGAFVIFVRRELWGALPVAALFVSGYGSVFVMRVRESLTAAKSEG